MAVGQPLTKPSFLCIRGRKIGLYQHDIFNIRGTAILSCGRLHYQSVIYTSGYAVPLPRSFMNILGTKTNIDVLPGTAIHVPYRYIGQFLHIKVPQVPEDAHPWRGVLLILDGA